MINFIFVPGFNNSEARHWQRLWLNVYTPSYCIEQDDWNNPNADIWAKKINDFVLSIEGPKIFIAHSLACPTIAHWANNYDSNDIMGALFVAPPNVFSDLLPPNITGYKDLSLKKLPFKSLLIASSTDKFCELGRARYFADKWSSEFINLGDKGHINLKSNLGVWTEGQAIFNNFIKKLKTPK